MSIFVRRPGRRVWSCTASSPNLIIPHFNEFVMRNRLISPNNNKRSVTAQSLSASLTEVAQAKSLIWPEPFPARAGNYFAKGKITLATLSQGGKDARSCVWIRRNLVSGKLGVVGLCPRVESGVKEEILTDFFLFNAQIRRGSGIAVLQSNKSVRICTTTPHSKLHTPH